MSKTCPNCKKVYEDDVNTCPDCNVELTDEAAVNNEPEEIRQVSVFSLTNEESAQRVIEYMKEQGVEGEYRYNLREKTYKIFVAQPDARNALRACTSFYAEEAKRIKAEEDRIREEEEARLRAEEEARLAAEEERRRLEEEAIRQAEEEARLKAEEAERIRLEAEEAIRKAEETARLLEEEAKRAAEEEERKRLEAEAEAIRKAEEEKRRIAAEEEAKRQAEKERRRKLFEQTILEAEAAKQEELKKSPDYIPLVEGETILEEDFFSSVIEDVPEEGPIFVETEPVDEYEVGDTITVDAVDIEFTEEEPEAEKVPETEEEAFSNFLAGFKKSKNTPVFDDEKTVVEKKEEPVVEDLFTDNVFAQLEKSVEESKQRSNEGANVVEEVINTELKSTSSKPDFKSKFASKFESLDDVDDGTYKGFIPDYSNTVEEDEDVKIAKSYGFDPEEYKKLKEETAKKAQDRKNNPLPKEKPANKDFMLVEEAPIDDYRGFVPDYTQRKDAEKMEFYTKRTSIDYSKYRTASDNSERNSLADLSATLRSSSQTELSKLFENDVLSVSSKPQDYIALKSSSYILALTGGQLNSLFTAWLMTNCTSATVKQYAKDGATPDENYSNKIDGIKNLLKQNFGKLDDDILEIIVKKFYNKYLDE